MSLQNNLIYFCGPHGSGKTTLMKEILKINPRTVFPELFSRNVKFNCDADYRQILKISGRAIENYEYLDYAKKNPDKIVLANRGVYDPLVYNEVYYKRGWINFETFQHYDKFTKLFFRNENESPYAIILNPGLEVVLRHLKKRWQEKEKKWREEDLQYAELSCNSYEKFRNNPKILYIDKEVDLEKKTEVFQSNDFIEKCYSRMPLVS